MPAEKSLILRKKELVFYIATLIFTLCFLTCSEAAPCYGTKMPQQKQISSGFQTYSISKRHLENEQGKIRSTQHFFLLSFGVYDWLSIDLKGGAGNIKQRPQTSSEVDYTSNFAGGYGFRLKFFDSSKTKMVFGFQHISVHPKTTHLGDVKNRAVLDDWQVSLLASYDFNKFTPYLGTRWSRVDYIHWIGADRKRVMSDRTKGIGIILGIDSYLTDKMWINLELQLVDANAFALSLNFKF